MESILEISGNLTLFGLLLLVGYMVHTFMTDQW